MDPRNGTGDAAGRYDAKLTARLVHPPSLDVRNLEPTRERLPGLQGLELAEPGRRLGAGAGLLSPRAPVGQRRPGLLFDDSVSGSRAVHDRLRYLNRFESVTVAIVTPKPHQLRCFRTLPWLLCFVLVGPAVAFQQSAIEVEPLAKSTASWNGTLLPAYPTGQPEVTVLRIRIAPGARLPMHRHPVINAAVMMAGELTVRTEAGAILRLKRGEAVVEVVDQWHYGHNEGTEVAELIVFYAGVQGQLITQNGKSRD